MINISDFAIFSRKMNSPSSYSWFAIAVVILFRTTSADLSPSPWPYRQIYPPANESDERTPLYFAMVLSFGGEFTSIGALPGVQIALDYINNEPSILPGYTLHYTLTDSQVFNIITRQHSLKSLVKNS